METVMSNQPYITVIKPGVATTIQDLGRYGARNIGMPVAGAMDSYSFKQANYLVGNPFDSACIECTLNGPVLQFSDECSIAITGADMYPTLNGQPVPMNKTIQLKKHDLLELQSCAMGCRSYVAVAGGFDIKPQMGSVSTYTRAGIGGVNGSALGEGDTIPYLTTKKCDSLSLPDNVTFKAASHYKLRILSGPEFDEITNIGRDTFLNSNYDVTVQTDRMGCRLDGPTIPHKECADILSAPVQFGTVQLPANGLPMILLADSQTTGGYTRIANVASIDFPILGQLRPGNTVSFTMIDLAESQALYRRQNKDFSSVQVNCGI